jgi:hypothetical protein
MEQGVETVKRMALYFHQQLREEEYPRSSVTEPLEASLLLLTHAVSLRAERSYTL